jgi:hypothetical protein
LRPRDARPYHRRDPAVTRKWVGAKTFKIAAVLALAGTAAFFAAAGIGWAHGSDGRRSDDDRPRPAPHARPLTRPLHWV